VGYVYQGLMHHEMIAYHDHNCEAVYRRGHSRGLVILCMDPGLDIVNVHWDVENCRGYLDDIHPDKIDSSNHGVRIDCTFDHQMCAYLIRKSEAETHYYFGENARPVDSYPGDFRKVCGHWYYFERSTGWVACYHVAGDFYYRCVYGNQRDSGVLLFPTRDLPCRD
jgi:hypothetical protein